MRSETDACTSAQIPLQLELRVPDFGGDRSETEKRQDDVIVIDLVDDEGPEHKPGVVVIEL